MAKEQLGSDPNGAIKGFEEVVRLEKEAGTPGEWGFKALKQVVKAHFKLGRNAEMMASYKTMLEYIPHVTKNKSEKTIASILDHVSAGKGSLEVLQKFYETTLTALKAANNERLWFKTNLKLGKHFYDTEEYTALARTIEQLKKSCQVDDGSDDQKKGLQLLEVYALEIQLYTATKNNKKLKDLYHKCLAIKLAIPGPKITGVIRECGGKMYMAERNWASAEVDFFEAFRNYDDCGSPRRIACLKYLVLANMMQNSKINPFDSQEAKPHVGHPEIVAMVNLVKAFQANDVREFERILRVNRASIMDDSFVRETVDRLLRNIRSQVILNLVKPYTRIAVQFIAGELNITVPETEALLVSLILDGRLDAKIDQVKGFVVVAKDKAASERYSAIQRWAVSLRDIHSKTTAKIHV
jgi:COP9 signalosome complex subunit 2